MSPIRQLFALKAMHSVLSALWTHSSDLERRGSHNLVGRSFLLVTSIEGGGLIAVPEKCRLSLIRKLRPGEDLDHAREKWTRYFLSANATLEAGDTPLQGRSVGPLAAGVNATGTATLTLPSVVAAGSYYLLAQADGDGTVGELNEVNNTRAAIVRVGPDLTVSAFTAPLRAAAGGSLSVTDTIKNTGSATAGASVTAFYFSTDLTLDGTDPHPPQTRAVPALLANDVNTGTTTLTVPDLAPGTWFLLANADALILGRMRMLGLGNLAFDDYCEITLPSPGHPRR